MTNCIICKTLLKTVRAKICGSNPCKSAWKMQRNKSLPPKQKTCLQCAQKYNTIDPRNNFCSTGCRVTHSHKTKLVKYGKKSTTSPWEQRAEKVKKTMQERFNGSSKRLAWLKDRNFSSIEEFANKVFEYCEENKIAPNSKKCLEHFQMSTYMTRVLYDFNLQSVLHNCYRYSQPHLEISEFIKEEGFQFKMNARPDFMDGRELDIYLPDKNLAIEYHGLAHHSERPVFGPKNLTEIKKKHYEKFKVCQQNQVSLIQIFEDEWREKPEIIKSIIRNKLGITPNRIGARQCVVLPLDPQEAEEFFENNHISGNARFQEAWGLFAQSILVAAISVRKPWNKKYGNNTLEIARFASNLNTNVVGGFSKLLKFVEGWARENSSDTILTYSDYRWGSGGLYRNQGFTYLGDTGPGYFYEKDGIREPRFRHRKRPSEGGETEREQNNREGWYAIYDCGSGIFVKQLQERKVI